tara:strand:+ start:174 stop:404 length:231 start_codon:yes stop_codon:yes gene_type:complete
MFTIMLALCSIEGTDCTVFRGQTEFKTKEECEALMESEIKSEDIEALAISLAKPVIKAACLTPNQWLVLTGEGREI